MSSSKKMLFDENFFGKQYLNKYTITSLWNYCMNTIDDIQNEKYFFCRCKKFEYNHDYEKLMMYYWYTKYFLYMNSCKYTIT